MVDRRRLEKGKVMKEKPEYADFDSPEKFQAILGIIGTRLKEHPKAYCSYSGGGDSDILIDLLERARKLFSLGPIDYYFFDTGLELKATREHVKETAEKYGVEILAVKPEKNIVQATREFGIPLISKHVSEQLEKIRRKNIPLSIREEFKSATDKRAKLEDLKARYPGAANSIHFICSCYPNGNDKTGSPFSLDDTLHEFMKENPPEFKISAKCCDYCKKAPAAKVQKNYEMVITGERKAEGGVRAYGTSDSCFIVGKRGKIKFKPLHYVSDQDKVWYKEKFGIRYSDAYEVYGFKRTGCCGCSISARAISDLERLAPFEPNLVKAAWNIFGDSYRYRQKFNEYRKKLKERKRKEKNGLSGQCGDHADESEGI